MKICTLFYISMGPKTWNPQTSTGRSLLCMLWIPCPYYKFGNVALNLQFIDLISWMRTVASFLRHQTPPTTKSRLVCLCFTCSAKCKRISEVMISIRRHSHCQRPDGTSRAGRLFLPSVLGKPHRKQ